ncbi:MAG: NADH-quinone oxidoreductase, partial [Acidobacteria bacterium]|nr:NADH-quinone oxidoreductase [Acidobacteriota bacterium]
GEVQRLKPGPKVMGSKSDLDIMGLLAREMGIDLGIPETGKVFEEIRRPVPGYNVPPPVIATGGAAQTSQVNGRITSSPQPELIRPAGDTRYTSGTLSRFSAMLNRVMEAPGQLYKP